MSSASILKAVRLTHLYMGVFIAPALLFFAFTGALQTFSLHEPGKNAPYKPAASYRPPQWAVVLGQIHKNQTPVVNAKKPQPPAEAKPEKHADAPVPAPMPAPAQPQHNPLPLKIFFLFVSIGLFTSTLTGVYMSYKYARNKIAISALLLLGVAIPVLLTIL